MNTQLEFSLITEKLGALTLPGKVQDERGNLIYYTVRLDDLLRTSVIIEAIVRDSDSFSPLLTAAQEELKGQNIFQPLDDESASIFKEWKTASEIARKYFQSTDNQENEQFVPNESLKSTWNLLSKLAAHPSFISDSGIPHASNRYLMSTKVELDLMGEKKLPSSPFEA